MTTKTQAASDKDAYVKAMISGDTDTCIAIEKKHGLFGYSPEHVCIGLTAADYGKNAEEAVEDYLWNRS